MKSSAPQKHPSTGLSVDRCGCAMGARFLGVTLIVSIVWFALHWHKYSLGRAGVRILIFAFAGAVLGKLVGIAVYRFRTRSLRDMVSAIARHALPGRPLNVARENGKDPRQPGYPRDFVDATQG